MKVISNDNRIENNFAMFLELTDKQLMFVQETGIKNVNVEKMLELMASNGNNAHIIQLVLTDNDIRMKKNYETLLKIYDTVSWFNREDTFNIRRQVCHH